jgi:hypothetical protein
MGCTSWAVDQIFYQTIFSTMSSKWKFYILLCFQFLCYSFYAHFICIYFELKTHHSILLNFVIQSQWIVPDCQLVILMGMKLFDIVTHAWNSTKTSIESISFHPNMLWSFSLQQFNVIICLRNCGIKLCIERGHFIYQIKTLGLIFQRWSTRTRLSKRHTQPCWLLLQA